MRSNKVIIAIYVLCIITGVFLLVISCNKNKAENHYVFSMIPDESHTISQDSIDFLYNNGLTYKNLEGKDYLITNKQDKFVNYNLSNDILLWGPITILRDSLYNYDDQYKLIIEDNGNKVNIKLSINFISKFKGEITRITFIPSWLAYVEGQGHSEVIEIPHTIINFPNKLLYDQSIPTNFSWISTKENISGDPIILAIKVLVDYSEDKRFEEYMLLRIDNP